MNDMEPNAVKAMNDLLSVYSLEQLQQLADMSRRLKERAIERECEQNLSIEFSGNGHPKRFNGSDNVKVRPPKIYSSE